MALTYVWQSNALLLYGLGVIQLGKVFLRHTFIDILSQRMSTGDEATRETLDMMLNFECGLFFPEEMFPAGWWAEWPMTEAEPSKPQDLVSQWRVARCFAGVRDDRPRLIAELLRPY
jgi:hypothetical protein